MNINPEDFKNVKVIIIDDDNFLLDMYALKFKKYGFDVNTASNGKTALAKLEDGTYVPDIIVCDIIMPQMTGLMFLEALREKKLAPNAVVIVLSNQGAPADIEAAQKFGIDDYIIKALAIPTEVAEKVIEVFNKKRPH